MDHDDIASPSLEATHSADRQIQPAVCRLAEALRFPTVAAYPEPGDPAAYAGFLALIRESFPALFATAKVTLQEPWRIVFEIEGSDQSLPPLLMLGHYDVVGADEAAEEWTHGPFDGVITDEHVWGRGAIDDKSSVMAILEAAEAIVAAGRRPARGLVIALGGDEELNGTEGAKRTAAGFRAEGRRFHFIVEEGSVITNRILAGTIAPLALIGLSEKGIASFTVTAEAEGGHAGRPPSSTAVGVLSRAIALIEDNPFPIRLVRSVEALFRPAGAVARGMIGFAYRHPRLMWPLMSRIMARQPATNAIIRTTQAVTMVQGGSAVNVLPSRASCVINVRLLPGDTVESVLARYRKLLANSGVTVELRDPDSAHDPAPETPIDHEGYRAIERCLAAVAPEVRAASYILTDSTDSKFYADLSEATLRFVPITLSAGDLPRVHGVNERVGIEDYLRMISFYSKLFGEVCWHD